MDDFLILDGAVGTQLEAYNVPLVLPIWSADANLNFQEVVIKIHKAYILADLFLDLLRLMALNNLMLYQ